MKKRRKSSRLSQIGAFLLASVLLIGLCPPGVQIRNMQVTVPKVKAAESISNPRIVEDSSMDAGQKVTWDCIWFGSYPQSEVTKEDSIYDTLKSASGWDSNNDITVNGTKYRRLKGEDATYYETDPSEKAGMYDWEDNYNEYHYFKYEPIKWRVLYKENGKAFLLSDIALDDQKYNINDTDTTWENCSIRSWLNGYGASINEPQIDYTSNNFINSAFSQEEKNAIKKTNVVNNDNISYDTAGGNDTVDKIFLLSESEIYDGSLVDKYGFTSNKFNADEAKRSHCSVYASAMGTYQESDFCEYTDNALWLLRSPGQSSNFVCYINLDGSVEYNGSNVDDKMYGIRPALYLDLSASASYSYAGTVCSDGTYSEDNTSSDFISNKTKYSIKDAYSFKNKADSIDLKLLKRFFNPIVAYKFYIDKEGKDGLCHGMAISAMASSIYSSPACTTYGKNQLFNVNINDKSTSTTLSALDYIKCAYIHQLTEEGQQIYEAGKRDLDGLYKAVVNYVIHGGNPVVVSIRGDQADNGHTLWVLGVGENNESETKLIVYDCNWPGVQCSVLLKKENGKYVSWEYTLGEGKTWGTGKVNADLRYYNPVNNFIDQFEKKVGYKQVKSKQSRFLISVNNTSSKIVNKNNKQVVLSPNINDSDIRYIKKDCILPESNPTVSNYSFWGSVGNKIKFYAGAKQTKCGFASDESGIDLSIPQNTEAEVSVQNKDKNNVTLSMNTKDKYKVTYNTVNQKDGMNQIIISGQDAAKFSGKQTKDGIFIESDSLKSMDIELEEFNEEGKAKKLVSGDISTNSNKILINNNIKEERLIVKEDSDGDGKVDKDIISVGYGKTKVPLKKKVSAIRLSGISKRIAAGKKITLKASVLPANATNKKLTWKSSNTKVATVSQSGVVTLKKNSGGKKVTITATAQDGSKKSALWKLTSMKGIVKNVKVSGKTQVKAGKSITLKAKVSATKKANTKLKWSSSNTKVSTVSQKGVVKANKKAKGKTVKITAMATDGSNKKATIKVKIK